MKKILILLSNPKNSVQLRLGEEIREIKEALKQSKNREQFQVESESAVRVKDLRRALLEYEPAIVHFSGHGSGTNGLILENDSGETQLVSSEALAQLFKQFQQEVQCVVLNACYSEEQAKAIHQYIDCVVGMNKAVGDVAAINFSTAFYEALGAGKSYDKCFNFACNSIDLEGIPESDTPQIRYRPRHYISDIQETQQAKNTDDSSFQPMSEQSQSPSITLSDNATWNLSKSQFGGQIIGRDNIQTQNFYSDQPEKQLTVTEVVTLIQKIETIFQNTDLPATYQEKAQNYIENAQEAVQEDEPDKTYAAKSLQKANKVLKDANLWPKFQPELQPLFTQLEPWLEVSSQTLSKF
ncbi:CHAT domain-containing protein [Capilliphycus salinus ALCB114379]|uniref:CHAT domain-containing protein n=1 Tax=Capilliphycus salinus TaxID=2768948 RepID=UPI0039A5A399